MSNNTISHAVKSERNRRLIVWIMRKPVLAFEDPESGTYYTVDVLWEYSDVLELWVPAALVNEYPALWYRYNVLVVWGDHTKNVPVVCIHQAVLLSQRVKKSA